MSLFGVQSQSNSLDPFSEYDNEEAIDLSPARIEPFPNNTQELSFLRNKALSQRGSLSPLGEKLQAVYPAAFNRLFSESEQQLIDETPSRKRGPEDILKKPPEKKQKTTPTHQTMIHDLFGELFTNNVLPFLGMNDRARTARTCRALRRCCQEAKIRRLQELFLANKPRDLFAPFGIVCPSDRLPPEEASRILTAIKHRVKTIGLHLPENLRPTLQAGAGDLVVQHHPDLLRTFLQTAYNYSLRQALGEYAEVPTESSLEDSVQRIHEWLKSDKLQSFQNHLSLHKHLLLTIPTEIGLLKNLKSLYASTQKLANIPTQIGQLTNLLYISLDNNQLPSLPAEIGQLTSLQTLWLHNNHLSSIPTEIGRLIHLQNLNLNNNQLSSLPAEIGQLVNLKILALNNNLLTSIPAHIEQLTNLLNMHLGNNQLTSLPTEIGRLTSLKTLDLRNNDLTSLPEEFDQLTRLERLELSGNSISRLPAAIQNRFPPTVFDAGNHGQSWLRGAVKKFLRAYQVV